MKKEQQSYKRSIILLSLREAFIDLIPFFVLRASCTLFLYLINTYFVAYKGSKFGILLLEANLLLSSIYPVVVVISLSLILAKNNFLPKVPSGILSLLIFILSSERSLYFYEEASLKNPNSNFYMILIPIVTIYMLVYIKKIFAIRDIKKLTISDNLHNSLQLLVVYMFVFVLVTLVFTNLSFDISKLLSEKITVLSIFSQMMIATIFTQLFWFLGVHGSIAHASIFSREFFDGNVFEGTGAIEFFNIFIAFGGAGATWSLIIAIFLIKKNKRSRKIAKLSIPFSIFNINEVLIYGLPIIFNRFYIIPFLFVPVICQIIAGVAFHYDLVSVVSNDTKISWLAPIIINAYVVFGIKGVILQISLIIIGVCIYLPFVKKVRDFNSNRFIYDELQERFNMQEEAAGLSEEAYRNSELKSFEVQTQIKNEITTLDDLLLYYQPKVSAKTGDIVGYEALLRKRVGNKIMTPKFLFQAKDLGLIRMVDHWVVKRVSNDLAKIKAATNIVPNVSININPKTLSHKDSVNYMINFLSEFQVEIEIVEQGIIANFEVVNESVKMLKKCGINTSIDDFGSGYSSLTSMRKLNVYTVKLDKSLLFQATDQKGVDFYKNVCALCHSLNLTIVAEGVETKEQAELARDAGAEILQGWYYSKAIPISEVKTQLLTEFPTTDAND